LGNVDETAIASAGNKPLTLKKIMKILVADDDPIFQMLLTHMLSEWGYDVL